MAASVVCGTWDGQIISENRGGVVRDYIPDPLGNTIALIDETHTITDTWTYWPYGEIQSHGGSSTTQLTFLGTLGYFRDFLNQLYVRARHLRVDVTRWMTVDPLWPNYAPYGYCGEAPVRRSDPMGLTPTDCVAGYQGCLNRAAADLRTNLSFCSNEWLHNICYGACAVGCTGSAAFVFACLAACALWCKVGFDSCSDLAKWIYSTDVANCRDQYCVCLWEKGCKCPFETPDGPDPLPAPIRGPMPNPPKYLP